MWRTRHACVICLLAACSDVRRDEAEPANTTAVAAPTDPWYFRDLPDPQPVPRESLEPLTLRVRATYGTLDGLGALDALNHVVVTDSLVIAVLFRSCEFVVFSRRTQAAIRRFGRCGRGPDEFQNLSNGAVTGRGDTLLVIDDISKRARLFTTSGKLLRTVAMDSVLPRGARVFKVAWLRDSLLVMSLHLPPHQLVNGTRIAHAKDAPALVSWHLGAPTRLAAALIDGPAVADSVHSFGRTLRSCVIGDRNGGEEVVAVNAWAPQVVILSAKSLQSPKRNVRYPVSEPVRKLEADVSGRILPSGNNSLACGDSLALISRRPFAGVPGKRQAAEFFALNSERGVFGYVRIGTEEEVAIGTLVAGHGSNFFLLRMADLDYPELVELSIHAGKPQASSMNDDSEEGAM